MTRDRVSDRGGATLAGADGWSVARGPAPATLDAVHLVQPLGIPGGGRPPRAARPPRDPPASGRPAGGRRDARPPRLDGLVSATGPGEGDGPPPGGAIFAAAALRVLGHRPRPLELEAVPDTDHVAAPFRVGGGWGASAKSNFSGLRYRAPVYRTLRELVMRYFEGYVNLRGDRTLRPYSPPVDLRRFDRTHRDWMATDDELWWIPQYLVRVPTSGCSRPPWCGLSGAWTGARARRRWSATEPH